MVTHEPRYQRCISYQSRRIPFAVRHFHSCFFPILPCDNCLATRGFGGGGRARQCWDGGPDSRTVVVSRSQHTHAVAATTYLPTLQLKLRLLAGVKQTAFFETSIQSHSLPCVCCAVSGSQSQLHRRLANDQVRQKPEASASFGTVNHGTFSTFSPRGARRGRCPGIESTMHVSGDPSAGCLVTILKVSRLVA
ncbi:hypothetical protein BT67DRAFT_219286 [Trichocladium antarcticum]|uniref:Uncharacterized protein n=1 Tax=Trichocladium antarcticum TaxID=1450529 RepID=A0AAN6UCF0_9PEZI|nr:hypothetical protein BT67DRAFT_219286 [Trichocladium antarcticum]